MLKKIIGGLAIFVVSPVLWAFPYVDTGDADELVGWADLPSSGDAAEQAFLEDALGLAPGSLDSTYQKLAGSGGEDGGWMAVDDGDPTTDLWAYDFGELDVIGFLIKTGSGVTYLGTEYDTFAYLNNGTGGTDSTRYGVIDLALFGRTHGELTIEVVSHVAVPEPGMLSLLGAGLLAAGFAGRRRRTIKR